MVYFELIYSVCCSELSASQDFPRTRVFNKFLKYSMHHCQKSPDSFPLLSSPESTVIEVFLVSVFHACPQFSFVVPTVECIRG